MASGLAVLAELGAFTPSSLELAGCRGESLRLLCSLVWTNWLPFLGSRLQGDRLGGF